MGKFLDRGFLPDYRSRSFGELMKDANYAALIGTLTGAAMNLPSAAVDAMRNMTPQEAARAFVDAAEQSGTIPTAIDSAGQDAYNNKMKEG